MSFNAGHYEHILGIMEEFQKSYVEGSCDIDNITRFKVIFIYTFTL
jgi:hypothetical protein